MDFHDPSGSLVGMVIDFGRSLHLDAADPEWSAWLGPRLSGCVALEVMDDSLTRWRALYAQPQGRQYLVPITTPPGKDRLDVAIRDPPGVMHMCGTVPVVRHRWPCGPVAFVVPGSGR